MGSTQLRGRIEYFLTFLFSNFRSHIKDSKWGRKYIFMNHTCCNLSPQKIPFQFANGKLPHSCCIEFWAISIWSKILLRSLCESRQLWCLSQIGLLTKKCLYWDSNTFRINVYGNDAKWHLTTPQGCKKRKIEMELMCVVCIWAYCTFLTYLLYGWK